MTDAELDALVERARQTFNVPGVAVAVVHQGRVEHVKAYGIRDIDSEQAVDTQTLFKIASLSKAFNSAALATLVDVQAGF
ncbi:serine hydrolase [Pseudobowmanella zhangzhouensis]|uniref:serine hydrolase n=1 Tax=Pseudobowmanella zhangzhouensis TaxID=1537679 RepID=UPI00361E7283